MGANTMVAAIGLVLGPVLGGALVAISWHWVFWFNVPFALAGAAWGALILRELAKPDSVRGYDVLGTSTFVVGLTGLVLGVSRGGLTGWNDPIVIGGLAAAAVLLPLWVPSSAARARRCSTCSIFRNRLFAAASAAAFINGLARFALMFLFVFYFQGAQGNSPIDAGIKLIPLALGMLVASPLAGIYADRHGSRALAAIGMLVSAAGLAAMTTLQVHTPYWQSALWLAMVGVGSGMFNSPNTAAMMGVVPANRRGIAAGARTLLQNTGAVLSIAFVLAIVTSAVPKATLFAVFSGLAKGLSRRSSRRSSPTCTSPCGCSPRPRCSARSCACCARSHVQREHASAPAIGAVDKPHPRPRARRPHSATHARACAPRAALWRYEPAHRRRRPPGRHHAAHDPLLRGDRPAARGARAPSGQHRIYTTRRSSACAR